MQITILHMFPDLMNLYGDDGNVKALAAYLRAAGIDVCVKQFLVEEPFDAEGVDIICVGSGTEAGAKRAGKKLAEEKEKIDAYINAGGFVLATGNGFELFGEEGSGTFPYTAAPKDARVVSECLCKTELIPEYVIGFVNHANHVTGVGKPFMENIKGYGESFHKDHFYGMHLIGPVLARNPAFLRYFAKELIKSKDASYEIPDVDLSFEEQAYAHFIEKYTELMQEG